MKYILSMLLLLAMVACSEVGHKGIYSKMAQNIAAKIPSGSKVAIKITSPEKNGLPENFLQKLVAEFAEALIKASDSKFVVLNRNSTEEIWKEAIEFNNQDAEKITSSAEADISITLSPKISQGGIDLSIIAYSLKDGSTGNMLASASELIPMDVKAELGVDVQSLDKKIDQLSQLIDKEKAAKGNELAMLFYNFGLDPNTIAHTYPSGCSKPVASDVRNTVKWSMQCEVYSDGKLLKTEGMDFNKSIDIEMFLGSRTSVSDLVLSWHDPSGDAFVFPESVKNFTTLLACTEYGEGKKVYKVSLPNKERYFLEYASSSGSGGISISLSLFDDYHKLPKIGDSNYNLKLCS